MISAKTKIQDHKIYSDILDPFQGPLPTPSASGTSCLMERELAPGKTMNFNASGHSNQTEARLPGKARRGFKILWPQPPPSPEHGAFGRLVSGSMAG